jgi:hypothetical protein
MQILDSLAVTSRAPHVAAVFPDGKNFTEGTELYGEFLKKAGATHYFLLHNHPSGDPSPSSADVRATTALARELKESNFTLAHHIVINHQSYSTIDDIGVINTHKLPDTTAAVAEKSALPHQWPNPLDDTSPDIGRNIVTPERLAEVGTRVQEDRGNPENILGFFTNIRGNVVATVTGNLEQYGRSLTTQALQEYGRNQGATHLLLHAKANSLNDALRLARRFEAARNRGDVIEIVVEYPGGYYSAVESRGSDGKNFFSSEGKIVGTRVQEQDSFSLTPRTQITPTESTQL